MALTFKFPRFLVPFQTFGHEEPSFEVSLVHKIDGIGLAVANGHSSGRNNIGGSASPGGGGVGRSPNHMDDEQHWDHLMNGGDWSPERCALAEKTKRKWLQKASSTKGLIRGLEKNLDKEEIITVKVENNTTQIATTHSSNVNGRVANSQNHR